jgi:hypothetical protein
VVYQAALAALVMVITVYVPRAGGINGGGRTASGVPPRTGYAACGWRYPFGTVFEIQDDMEQWSLPRVVVCMDRGGWVGNYNLDIALVSEDVRKDLLTARTWGRQRRQVVMYPCMNAYLASRVNSARGSCT